jgi:hypothetical protein
MGMISKSGFTVLGMLGTVGVMVSSYPFAVDDKNKLDYLYATLPIDKKTIVIGRYIYAAFLVFCVLLCAFCIASAVAAIHGKAAQIKVMFTITCVLFALGLLFAAIQFPIYFKLGFTKGRIAGLVPFIVFCALAAISPVIFKALLHISFEEILIDLSKQITLVCISTLLFAIFAYCASAFISHKIYAEKDI